MSTTSTSTTTDKQPFVTRVANIPIINEGLTNAHSVIQSNTYSAAAYDKATDVAGQIYKVTEPLQHRLGPQIEAVDNLANKSLDFVQSKFPYAFEATSGDVMSKARKPADEAAAVAKAKLGPLAEQFSSQLQAAQTSLHSVQERLASALASLPRSPAEATNTAKEATSAVLGEIEKIRDTLSAQAKELPAHLQSSYHNLSEHLQKAIHEIGNEIGKADVPYTTKASQILTISKTEVGAVLQETINAVKQAVSSSSSTSPQKKQVNGDSLSNHS